MYNKPQSYVKLAALCGMFALMNPVSAFASEGNAGGPGIENEGYIATVDVESVNINKFMDSDEVLATATQGSQLEVLTDLGNGWMKVKVKDMEGYLPVSGNATVTAGDLEEESSGEGIAFVGSEASSRRRESLVNYAVQFVGGPYRYGGVNPKTGADCSGFTQYVLKNGAGVSLNRSSTGQSRQGVQVNSGQMRPGDLIFYGSSVNHINHVAMYIGNGQIIHASTYKTGIKISNWNYRSPVRIMNVLGD